MKEEEKEKKIEFEEMIDFTDRTEEEKEKQK